MRFRVVDACDAAFGVPAVSVFAVGYYDAGVEEGAADGPEEGGEAARLEGGMLVRKSRCRKDKEERTGKRS